MSPSEDRVLKLSHNIHQNSSKLAERASILRTELPSLDAGIPKALQEDSLAAEARQAVLDDTLELAMIMKGPETIVTPMHNAPVSIHVIVQRDIASRLPVDGNEGKTFAQLAKECSLDEDLLKRIMRHACAMSIFKEEPKGVVRHNAASRALAQNPILRQYIGMVSGELWPAATRLSDALQKWPGSQEPNNTAFNIAHSTELPCFQFLSAQPERVRRFGDAMTWFAKTPAFDPCHLINNYDFGKHGEGTFVDIGGSHGTAALAVVQKFPRMKCIVQDLSDVVREGRSSLRLGEDRVTFTAHDFFAEQPVKGASVYFLRQILHDWSDKYAAQILSALLPALTRDSTILIMEQILPEPGTVPLGQELAIRSRDLAMLAMANGKERDIDDWRSLLQQVDGRLAIEKVMKPIGSALSLLEVHLQSP